jgi:hypothetical protein
MGVNLVVWVSLGAVSFANVGTSTTNVLGQRYRLEMKGIDTALVRTEVIQSKTIWDRPDKKLIRESMSQYGFDSSSAIRQTRKVKTKHTVTRSGELPSSPLPTIVSASKMNFAKKSFKSSHGLEWH